MDMLGGNGMEGNFFYWTAWVFWVIATFFVKKESQIRTKVSACILFVIILSPYFVHLFGFEINLAFLFLYFFMLFQIIQEKRKVGLYIFFPSFVIMLAYGSFQLFELFDPVWVMFKREWMIAVMLLYLCVLLHSDNKKRLYTLIIGIIQGELIYSMILKRAGFSFQTGTELFFDTLAASVFVLFILSIIETVIVYFDHQLNLQGRERQKST
jgi:hypothetical protein